MGMGRFPIMGMLKHNTDGEHYNSPFQGGEQVTGVPVPKSKGSPGVMQAPKQGCRNSEIRNANSNVHHLCLKCLGSGQRRQQKPTDCSWAPAEQVWDLFLQRSSVGESQWRIQRAPRSLQIPWASPAKQKHWQERKFLAGINHHQLLTKEPVLLICPGVLSTHSRDLQDEEIRRQFILLQNS